MLLRALHLILYDGDESEKLTRAIKTKNGNSEH